MDGMVPSYNIKETFVMKIDLKDGELALIESAIIRDIKMRLNDLSKMNLEYHDDLDEVASKLRLIQQIITIEDTLWKCRAHLK